VNPDEIQQLLLQQIPGCTAEVDVDGSHVNLMVVSDQFEGLNTLKKQQLVYGALNAAIADGRIHAVHMKTLTPTEWSAERA
jgi:acid stress-induced BolA-like protein IbaG/YrbA